MYPELITAFSNISIGFRGHTLTDHAKCDICSNSPHLVLFGVLAMRAKQLTAKGAKFLMP